jgi:hypothetical protein
MLAPARRRPIPLVPAPPRWSDEAMHNSENVSRMPWPAPKGGLLAPGAAILFGIGTPLQQPAGGGVGAPRFRHGAGRRAAWTAARARGGAARSDLPRLGWNNGTGHVVLGLEAAWRDGTTHLATSPMAFMQCLAALVPRPHLRLRTTASRRSIPPSNYPDWVACASGWPAIDRQVCNACLTFEARSAALRSSPDVQQRRLGTRTRPSTAGGGGSLPGAPRTPTAVVARPLQRCPDCGGELKLNAILKQLAIERVNETAWASGPGFPRPG